VWRLPLGGDLPAVDDLGGGGHGAEVAHASSSAPEGGGGERGEASAPQAGHVTHVTHVAHVAHVTHVAHGAERAEAWNDPGEREEIKAVAWGGSRSHRCRAYLGQKVRSRHRTGETRQSPQKTCRPSGCGWPGLGAAGRCRRTDRR